MKAVHGVYDIETGVVESVYEDKEQAARRAGYLHDKTGNVYSVYAIAVAPELSMHWHYRISEMTPTDIFTFPCYDALCSRRPRYFTGEEFKYWSVESCEEKLTRNMANHLLTGGIPPGLVD